jgi:hypothetical protein
MSIIELPPEQSLTDGYVPEQRFTDEVSSATWMFTRLPRRLLPYSLFGGMVLALILLDALLPLQGLWFNDALLTSLGSWPLLPSQALFPTWKVIPPQEFSINAPPPGSALGWLEVCTLLAALGALFMLYLYALYRLPDYISRRYIMLSTLGLGVFYLIVPVVTSSDLFSYLIYARMGVIYHLNPLTTLPTDIHYDAVYPYLYWVDQPSAYGPTWAAISCLLEWLAAPLFGVNNIVASVILLRLLGLATHLGSTWLIWSIGGSLQQARGLLSPRRRLLATLAFAWNPLLLFEACVNAHNDSTLLFLILLALWLLVRGRQVTLLYALVTLLLALAACLKINAVVLFPGLLFLLRATPQARRNIAICLLLYVGTIVLLYTPFWNGGAVLNVLLVNPSTSRNINTLAEFAGQLYNALVVARFSSTIPIIGSPGERLTHIASMALFAALYLWLCWKAFRQRNRIATPLALIRWMALVWLLYCAIGTPWFWPWYLVSFFGLYALLEAAGDCRRWAVTFLRGRFLGALKLPLTFRLLSISMLMLYCSYAWVLHGTFIPLLPGFKLAYLRGLLVWLLPPALALICWRSGQRRQTTDRRSGEHQLSWRTFQRDRALLPPEPTGAGERLLTRENGLAMVGPANLSAGVQYPEDRAHEKA